MSEKSELVFVYGTLKSGHGNNRILKWGGAVLLGDYVTEYPYPMFVSGLPYLIERRGEGKHVIGEVWACDCHTVADMDRLEGHPIFYERKAITVRNINNERTTTAWVYFYQGDPRSKIYLSEYKPLAYSSRHV